MKAVLYAAVLIVIFCALPLAAEDNTGTKSTAFDPNLDYAQVEFVSVRQTGDTWWFSVKVKHADDGWDHYAGLWEVVDPVSGEVYGKRVLLHPHDTEQPFERSLSGVIIPEGISTVFVRAKCTLHGFGGKEVVVELDKVQGPDYRQLR